MNTPLTHNLRPDGAPVDLRQYEAAGGYQGLRRALGLDPRAVIAEVQAAKVLGRGGAGFDVGDKWSFATRPEDDPRPRFVVINADEMEPGTFKDRLLLEGDPHQVIEGAMIGAWAIQAQTSFLFLRWEYRRAAQVLEQALAEAYAAGYLGQNLLGSGWDLEMRLHVSAGRYMAGEADALLNVIEGRRALPRNKPPHQTLSGLWGGPTITNNVESFACVPHILREGADWFRGLSLSPAEGGTKLYGVSGQVNRPGLWELPLGTPLRELVEGHAGGMRGGRELKGLLPGGASSDFLLPEHLDTPMDFASVEKAGSRLGTGTVIVMDDSACPIGALLSLARFFARESCGWCTPCRDGLPWTVDVLTAFEEGRARAEDLDLLEEHTRIMGSHRTFCTLAPGAMMPLRSALKFFRKDFERHLYEGRCPYQQSWGGAR